MTSSFFEGFQRQDDRASLSPMRQTFDETTDRSFASQHLPMVRAALLEQGLDGFIVPHEDEHQNEYLPAANDRLGWISGFTGSAGCAVVMLDQAAMFTDGRYTLQVQDQVDEGQFRFHDLTEGGVAGWLRSNVKAGQRIGFDARLHSPDSLVGLKQAVEAAGGKLKSVAHNPVDQAWGARRPPPPKAPVVRHPLIHSGLASSEKRQRIAAELKKAGLASALITAPASIAWLFNIRGGDVIRSPLPLAQALLDQEGHAKLFLDPDKLTADLPAWLGNEVSLHSPAALPEAIAGLKGKRVAADPAQSSAWYFDQLEDAGAKVVRITDPCALPRACKNPTEVEGARRAHERDGGAVVQFLHWLATTAQTSLPDEIEVVTRLESFREATGALKDLSFDTIAGAGPNGAIVHYRPTQRLNRRVTAGSLLLVDSGAQYLEGTTDITRTVAIGQPTLQMRRCFTLVLKGHLALGRVRFPMGTTGSALDALARAGLWAAGMDYDHGTGHGVGSYLGVHEGPQRIAKVPSTVALRPGMIVSNEPGYYLEGQFGIRIENLQVVTEARPIDGGDRQMLGFETLTLAPIDRNLIEVDLLSPEDRQQLDAYHARVLATIGPLVPPHIATWLNEVCSPL
jgi:Xaa-Pro aminopeptidase